MRMSKLEIRPAAEHAYSDILSPEVRDVQLMSSQSTEIHVQLRAPAIRAPAIAPAISDSVRRLFHR